LLAGIAGYVIADASTAYHELYRIESGIVEVGCWSHARRRLFDALAVDRERALIGIGFPFARFWMRPARSSTATCFCTAAKLIS
jgi:hypothetical protein